MDNDCDEENGVCTNTNGSYLCSCKMGFRFNGNGFYCSGQSYVNLDVVCVQERYHLHTKLFLCAKIAGTKCVYIYSARCFL